MCIFGHYINRSKLFFVAAFACIFLMAFLVVARQAAPVGASFSAGTAFRLVVLPAALVVFTLIALGCHRSEVRSSLRVLVERLCIAGVIGCGAILAAQGLALGPAPAALKVAAAVFGGCGAVIAAHLAAQHVLWFGSNVRRRAVVLGSGRKARAVSRLLKDTDLEVELVGFIEATGGDLGGISGGGGQDTITTTPSPIIPMPQDLVAYALSHDISEIVVAWNNRSASLPSEQLIACRLRGIAVTESGAFIERETRRIDLDEIDPSWLIFREGFVRTRIGAAIKRGEDLVIGAGLLFLFAPLVPIIGILIKLDSSGPILYRQERIGLNGRPFSILKFRTMRCDAEGDGRARWAEPNDTRVTSVGRLLRTTRLDEVPQIINVLRGEMSLVGPRPERPPFVAQLAQQIAFYNERHHLKPGITGWAQINCPYAASIADAREKLTYDIYYVKNWSLFLDLLILLQTVRILLFHEGAR